MSFLIKSSETGAKVHNLVPVNGSKDVIESELCENELSIESELCLIESEQVDSIAKLSALFFIR